MLNPPRLLAREFGSRTPLMLLGIGIALSLFDLAALYGAAVTDGVVRMSPGVGFLNHYGLISTVAGNAIALYATKAYYDGVCSIRTSKALADKDVVEPTLVELEAMVKGAGRYELSLYGLVVFGALCWALNIGTHLFGDPMATWGPVLDSTNHPWSFVAMRIHNLYTWLIIMPLVVHVTVFSSIQLRRVMTIASDNGALRYDLLNPDQRGGFGFVDNALIAFNI